MLPFSTSFLEVTNDKPQAFVPSRFDGHVSEAQLESWIVENPRLVGEPLLVLGRQLAEFEEDQDRLDVLALDQSGEIVLIELKVADSFRVTDLQALAYAGAYANRDPEDLARTFNRTLAKQVERPTEVCSVGGEPVLASAPSPPIVRNSANASSTSFDECKQRIVDFLEINDFQEWQPSQRIRIKLVAPTFPRRVLKTVKWLGDVYSMPVEAIAVRLFTQGDGRFGLTFERLLPLPEDADFDMTVRRREERKRSDNITRRPPIVPVLIGEGLLKDGQRLWLDKSVLLTRDRELYDPDSLAFQVEVLASQTGVKFAWRPDEQHEPELMSPSAVPCRVYEVVTDWTGEHFYSPVARSFTTEPHGQTLEQLALEKGVWSAAGES
jgi:hypothetical protein